MMDGTGRDAATLADALRGTGFAFVQAPEMRAVLERRPQGLTGEVSEAECWAHVAKNLARAPLKELATDMLAAVTREAVRGREVLGAVLRGQEARRAAGQAVSTLRRALDVSRAREALSAVVERLEAAMRERAKAQAVQANTAKPPRRDLPT